MFKGDLFSQSKPAFGTSIFDEANQPFTTKNITFGNTNPIPGPTNPILANMNTMYPPPPKSLIEAKILQQNPIITQIVELIKSEANLNCAICFAQYDSDTKFPVITCTNKHTFCNACVKKLNQSQPKSSRNLSFNGGQYALCPTCKTEFNKSTVQRNRQIQNTAVQVIPKTKKALQSYIAKSEQTHQNKVTQINLSSQSKITELTKSFDSKNAQLTNNCQTKITSLTQQFQSNIDTANRNRGLQEMNHIQQIAIKQLLKQKQLLKRQNNFLFSQFYGNYQLTKKQKEAIQENSRKIEEQQFCQLNQKQIKSSFKSQKYEINQLSTFDKYALFISTFNRQILRKLQLTNLNMAHNQLCIILQMNFPAIKSLDVSHNQLQFKNEVYPLQNIQSIQDLNLSFNYISTLPSNLSELQELSDLNLQSNKFVQFESTVLKIKQLKILNIKRNPLLPKNSQNLVFISKTIQRILADDIILKELYSNVETAKYLHQITVQNSMKIQSVRPMFQSYQFCALQVKNNNEVLKMSPKMELQNVVMLKLLKNNISTTKEINLFFPNLTTLSIIDPSLTEYQINDLSPYQLENLDIQCQNLYGVPQSFNNLKTLQSLKLKLREINQFPSFIYNLPQLEILELANIYCPNLNGQQQPSTFIITEKIVNLTNLTTLSLRFLVQCQVNIDCLLQDKLQQQRSVNLHHLLLQNLQINQQSLQKIYKLRNLQSLALINNSIQSLDPQISNLQKLTTLVLKKNKLSTLPSSLSRLALLQRLDLSQNLFAQLPNILLQLKSLNQLLIFNLQNQIFEYQSIRNINVLYQLHKTLTSSLPHQQFDISLIQKYPQSTTVSAKESFQQPPQFQNGESVQLDYCQQSSEFNQFNTKQTFELFINLKFYQIVNLKLSYCNLSNKQLHILRDKTDLQFLTSLDLSNNNLSIKQDDALFGSWLQLWYINFSHNFIQFLPSDFIKLKQIQILDLSHNSLKEFPQIICLSQTIIYINVSYNQISDSHGQNLFFFKANKLQLINLQFNSITNIPHWIYSANNMIELNISYNSNCIVDQQMKQMQRLQRLKAQLISFKMCPQNIINIPSLRHLQLSVSPLASFPKPYFQLNSQLLILSLEGYQYTTIPNQIYQMKLLKQLNLSNNDIRQIDQKIQSLLSLTSLFLRNNGLGQGLQHLVQMPELKLIDIQYNPINDKKELSTIQLLRTNKVLVLFNDELQLNNEYTKDICFVEEQPTSLLNKE